VSAEVDGLLRGPATRRDAPQMRRTDPQDAVSNLTQPETPSGRDPNRQARYRVTRPTKRIARPIVNEWGIQGLIPLNQEIYRPPLRLECASKWASSRETLATMRACRVKNPTSK
jgi:hypothetical protein